jgi:hypothetical protein
MRRRKFITLLGSGAMAWPLAGHTQTAIPVIGYLSSRSASAEGPLREPFLKSLEEGGFVLGRNVAIRGNIDRSTGRMAATLVMSDPAQQPSDPNTAAIRYDVVCKPSSN